MGIDSSIYSNIQTPQAPSLMNAAQGAMTLSQLGMQNQGLQYKMMQQQQQMAQTTGVRQAYSDNTDQNGNLNRQGFLSDLSKNAYTAPIAGDYANKFSAQDKAQYDAQSAQLDAQNKIDTAMMPKLQYLDKADPEDQPALYQNILAQAAKDGHPVSQAPGQFSSDWLKDTLGQMQGRTENYANLNTQANTAKTQAETAAIPGQKAAELNAALYGSRSPNAELSSQYQKEAAPIQASRLAMNQMNAAYTDKPGPQSDASLVLNAYKIKFPDKPDVNSLEELTKAQSAPDQWKQMAAHSISGGLDQGTKDNLMRDAASTFGANVTTLRGIQQKYQARAAQQNVNDPTLTAEPGIDETFANTNAIQKQIGPYVPPPERPGFMGSVYNLASKITGSGPSSANASAKPTPTTQDAAALNWLKSADPSDPAAFKVRAKLKSKGLL